MKKRPNFLATLTLLVLLTGCSVPRVPPTTPPRAQLPKLPALEPHAVGPAYLPRMQTLLSGKLPEQTDYALPTSGAKLNTTPLVTP